MMNSKRFLALTPARLQPTNRSTLWVSDRLTPSEIVALRQSKKSIADYVQKELPGRLRERHWEYMMNKSEVDVTQR